MKNYQLGEKVESRMLFQAIDWNFFGYLKRCRFNNLSSRHEIIAPFYHRSLSYHSFLHYRMSFALTSATNAIYVFIVQYW
mmetsp:Transcript_4233/g.9445  ORF Transcript_4233/g.9445 Transcript_4233/m.9445 type:complete len:80 (-) Transcript_4233:3-242(-)